MSSPARGHCPGSSITQSTAHQWFPSDRIPPLWARQFIIPSVRARATWRAHGERTESPAPPRCGPPSTSPCAGGPHLARSMLPAGGAGSAHTRLVAGAGEPTKKPGGHRRRRIAVSSPDFNTRGVAQPGSAPGLGPGGRGFKSRLLDHPSTGRTVSNSEGVRRSPLEIPGRSAHGERFVPSWGSASGT